MCACVVVLFELCVLFVLLVLFVLFVCIFVVSHFFCVTFRGIGCDFVRICVGLSLRACDFVCVYCVRCVCVCVCVCVSLCCSVVVLL